MTSPNISKFGGVIGNYGRDYRSSTKSGVFFCNEQMVLQKNAEWGELPGSTEASAIESIANADTYVADGLITEGTLWFKFGATHTAEQYLYKKEMWNDGSSNKGAIRVWRAVSQSTPTVNHLMENIPMDYICVGREQGSTNFYQSGEVEFSSQQEFNSTSTSGIDGTARNYWITGGTNYAGSRVMLGGAGRHGIYNTSQTACNWGASTGSIGAGFDGSCGTYPNGLKLGLGDGDAYYNNISGTFSFWVYNE